MPYSDNGAEDYLIGGAPKPGPTPAVDLMPYNRLVVMVHPQAVSQGTLDFEGSLDGERWYTLGLVQVDTGTTVKTVTLGGFSVPRAYALPLEYSATAHFRVVLSANVTGTQLHVTSRKENT